MSDQTEEKALELLKFLQRELILDSSYMSTMHKDKPQGGRVGMTAEHWWVKGVQQITDNAKGPYATLVREIDLSLRSIATPPEKDGYRVSRVKKGDPIWTKLEDTLGALTIDFQDCAIGTVAKNFTKLIGTPSNTPHTPAPPSPL